MLLVLAACAAKTAALESQSRQRDQRLARLYFFRPEGWVARAGTLGMKVNGQHIGEIGIASYLFVDRPPGTYTLEVAPPFDWGKFETDVQVAAGGTYYYAITAQSQTLPIGHGAVMTINESSPGARMQPKGDGINLATYRLNALDAATGAAEIAKLGAR